MITLTAEERMALLLCLLGEEATEVAFDAMNATQAKNVRQLVDEFRKDPPSRSEIEYVIGDFNFYFKSAMKELQRQKNATDQAQEQTAPPPPPSSSKKSVTYFRKVTPTGDPIRDLNQFDPFQIATALADDHAKTIALVLRHLNPSLAGSVIELLSPEVRSDVIVYLSQESTVPAPIVDQVLKSSVQRANSIEFREEEVNQAQAMAELLRTLPKDIRNDLLPKLEETDEELAKEIKANLYLFEDVLRLDDRDVQKVLGEVQSDSLIVGLQRCDPQIVEKLLNNLSKRARETILEEMEYKEKVTDEEIEEARAQLTAVLAKLDDSGEITLN